MVRLGLLLLSLLVSLAGTAPAPAELTIEFRTGLVTISAVDAPVSQILTEWSRVGGTEIVNADSVAGPPITLQLRDVAEHEVLDLLLRSVGGYVARLRPIESPGSSQFDRIMILPITRTVARPISATRDLAPATPPVSAVVDPLPTGSGSTASGDAQPMPADGATTVQGIVAAENSATGEEAEPPQAPFAPPDAPPARPPTPSRPDGIGASPGAASAPGVIVPLINSYPARPPQQP